MRCSQSAALGAAVTLLCLAGVAAAQQQTAPEPLLDCAGRECEVHVVLVPERREWSLRENVLLIPGDVLAVKLVPGTTTRLGTWHCEWDEKHCSGPFCMFKKTIHNKIDAPDDVGLANNTVLLTVSGANRKLGELRQGVLSVGPTVIPRRGTLTIGGTSTRPQPPRDGCNYNPPESPPALTFQALVRIQRVAR